MGLTIASTLFQHTLRTNIHNDPRLANSSPALIKSLTTGLRAVSNLDGTPRQAAESAYTESVRDVFFFTLGAMGLAALSSFWMRNDSLSAVTGNESSQAEKESEKEK